MTVYGSKVYGSFRYGIASTTDISVYPFTAQSLDYGTIKLSWKYPLSTANFTTFSIVRNPMGFPVTPDGGDLVYKTDKTALTTAGPGSTSLLGLEGVLADTGAFYDPITGSATATYTGTTVYDTNGSTTISLVAANPNIKVGQAVTYTPSGYLTGPNSGNGIVGGTTVATVNGTNITLSDAASIPGGTSLIFTPTLLTPGKIYYYSAFVLSNNYWIRVGTALGTSIKNYSTAEFMYNSLPYVYTSAYSSDTPNRNNDLYNFLRVIGIQYDLIKTNVDNAKNRYNINEVNGKLLPAFMDQMGFNYESGLGIQQGKRLLSNVDYIYLNKGTTQGIKQFVKSFTGYPADIAPFKNLFLTLDCASFEASTGFWNTSGNALSLVETTAAEEGGFPVPYSESGSPTGYPNSQLGYAKVEVTSVAAGSVWELSYGSSLDSAVINGFGSNNSPSGYSYITINTDTDHSFAVGDTVVLQGMSPNYINGIWEILSVPDSKAFTFYNPTATTSLSIYGGLASAKLYSPKLCGIPISASTNYRLSLYIYAPSARYIDAGIKWYDQRGTYISTSTGSDAVYSGDENTWYRLYYTVTSPTYAAYGVPFVKFLQATGAGVPALMTVGEKYYIDGLQLEVTPYSTKYYDPRRVDVYLKAPRINEVINPGFELATTNWATTGTSAFTTDSTAGNIYPTSAVGLGTAISTTSARLTANASSTTLTPSSAIPVTGGIPYAISAYIKAAGTNTATITVVWKNSGGTTLQTDTSSAVTLATTFTRVSLAPTSTSATQMYAPATAATATITFTITGANGNIYYVDSILFETSSSVNAYFDGSTGYNVTEDLIWEQNAAGTKGTASTGRSLYYPNRLVTESRLKAVLAEYLPIGTNYSAIIGTTIT